MPANPQITPLFLCCGLLGASTALPAAEWSASPNISMKTAYSDDLALYSTAKSPSMTYTLGMASLFAVAEENWQLSSNVGLELVRNETKDISDENNWNVNTDYSYVTPLNRYSLNALFQRDSTLGRELEETGVVSNQSERTLNRLTPTWTRQMGEKTYLQASAGFTDVSYKDLGTTTSASRDYQLKTATLGMRRVLSEQTELNANLSHTNYKTDDNLSEYKVNSLNIGAAQTFSETLKGSFSVGLRESHSIQSYKCSLYDINGQCIFQFPTQHSRGRGYNFAFGLNKAFETGAASLTLTRDSQPTSTEGVVESTRLAISVSHRFSHKLTGIISTFATSTQGLDDDSTLSARKYLTVHPKLSYQWSEPLLIDVGYRYTELKNASDETNKSNDVYLTLTYVWPKMAVSR